MVRCFLQLCLDTVSICNVFFIMLNYHLYNCYNNQSFFVCFMCIYTCLCKLSSYFINTIYHGVTKMSRWYIGHISV